MQIILLLAILLLTTIIHLSSKKLPALATVDKVDLNRYKGLWSQIAYFPNIFQPKNAKLTTAEYGLHPKGYITVKNVAYKDSEGRDVKSDIKGKAFIADKITNAKLKVQFFWPFKGNYWIILLDKVNYHWAVVSDPSRRFLWILAHKPVMDKNIYQSLLTQIEAKYINTSKIVITGKVE